MSAAELPPIKRAAHSLLGERAYSILKDRYHLTRAVFDPKYRVSTQRMRALKDKHRGERCFIVGNGPSLNDTDLSLLRNEVTFGLNRIYLIFDDLGFATTYYVSVNELVIEQCAEEIVRQVPCPKFISWRSRDVIPFTDDMMLLFSTRTHPGFFNRITGGVWEGATVTYVAMQIAYYLGFYKVVLIGVDHSFATKGKPHTMVVSSGDDPNHFHPAYFGKGFRWHLPDLETSELAYRMARERFDRAGRKIVDATIGGQLQVFPKVDYYTLLE
jgi:hypothetical protein